MTETPTQPPEARRGALRWRRIGIVVTVILALGAAAALLGVRLSRPSFIGAERRALRERLRMFAQDLPSRRYIEALYVPGQPDGAHVTAPSGKRDAGEWLEVSFSPCEAVRLVSRTSRGCLVDNSRGDRSWLPCPALVPRCTDASGRGNLSGKMCVMQDGRCQLIAH